MEKIFAKGIKVFKPNANAPEFIKAQLVVSIEDFKDFIKENEQHQTDYQGKKQIKLTLMENSKGLYLQLDTWKGKGEPSASVSKDDLPF